MLTIRPAQIAILGRGNEADTEARALRHLQQCIPEICNTLGETPLRDIIRWGRTQSRKYGIDREADFFRYLNLMFMFGFQFDRDARFPWAARTLQSDKRSRAKMDLLMDHAMLHCSRLEGAQAE